MEEDVDDAINIDDDDGWMYIRYDDYEASYFIMFLIIILYVVVVVDFIMVMMMFVFQSTSSRHTSSTNGQPWKDEELKFQFPSSRIRTGQRVG